MFPGAFEGGDYATPAANGAHCYHGRVDPSVLTAAAAAAAAEAAEAAVHLSPHVASRVVSLSHTAPAPGSLRRHQNLGRGAQPLFPADALPPPPFGGKLCFHGLCPSLPSAMFKHVFVAFSSFHSCDSFSPASSPAGAHKHERRRSLSESPAVQVDYVKNASCLQPAFVPPAPSIRGRGRLPSACTRCGRSGFFFFPQEGRLERG